MKCKDRQEFNSRWKGHLTHGDERNHPRGGGICAERNSEGPGGKENTSKHIWGRTDTACVENIVSHRADGWRRAAAEDALVS